MTGIYEFLQAWESQKLESIKGCPIKNYMMLVSCLNIWQARVSNIPNELITKGKLLLLSCHDVRAEMGECCLLSLLLPPYLIHMYFLGPGMSSNDLRCRPLIGPVELPTAPSFCNCRCEHHRGQPLHLFWFCSLPILLWNHASVT